MGMMWTTWAQRDFEIPTVKRLWWRLEFVSCKFRTLRRLRARAEARTRYRCCRCAECKLEEVTALSWNLHVHEEPLLTKWTASGRLLCCGSPDQMMRPHPWLKQSSMGLRTAMTAQWQIEHNLVLDNLLPAQFALLPHKITIGMAADWFNTRDTTQPRINDRDLSFSIFVSLQRSTRPWKVQFIPLT